MAKKLKAIVTTTLVYEPVPANYASLIQMLSNEFPSIEEIATIALKNLKHDSSWVVDDEDANTTVEIVIVEE